MASANIVWISGVPYSPGHPMVKLQHEQQTSSGVVPESKKVKKRIRQSSKPLLNRLETEFYNEVLKSSYNPSFIFPQAIRFKILNGSTLTPDFVVFSQPVRCYEVKGKFAWEDSLIKIRVAAKEFPMLEWVLVWKDDDGAWQKQLIIP